MATSAMHTSPHSFERPACHENTRVEVLMYLRDWAEEAFEEKARIMWMYGYVGAGKSTIAQTLAKQLHSMKKLLASFFFSRNDGSRSSYKSLVATIAYQAARTIPELKALINAAVEENPQIFDENLEAQAKELLVDPLNTLAGRPGFVADSFPSLIIVDGLDECDGPQIQCHILEIFAEVLCQCNFPLKIFVTSRQETNISGSFESAPLSSLSIHLALSDKYRPEDDIRAFLEDKFLSIRVSHPLRKYIPSSWPGAEVIETLVHKSSGQFVFASTVISFVSSLTHDPMERLDIIQNLEPNPSETDLPFAYLDMLYRHIFSRILAENLKMTLTIIWLSTLTSYFTAKKKFCLPVLSSFLSVKKSTVACCLAPLRSVISHSDEICILHASLTDFLHDMRRSRRYFIGDGGARMATSVQICLDHFERGIDSGLLQSSCKPRLIYSLRCSLDATAWATSLEWVWVMMKNAIWTPELCSRVESFQLMPVLWRLQLNQRLDGGEFGPRILQVAIDIGSALAFTVSYI